MFILIVDDEPLIAELLKTHLREILPDAYVISAVTSSEALIVMQAIKPNLVFVDLSCDGKIVGSRAEALGARVIVCTGAIDFKTGWDALLKPFDEYDLRRLMSN